MERWLAIRDIDIEKERKEKGLLPYDQLFPPNSSSSSNQLALPQSSSKQQQSEQKLKRNTSNQPQPQSNNNNNNNSNQQSKVEANKDGKKDNHPFAANRSLSKDKSDNKSEKSQKHGTTKHGEGKDNASPTAPEEKDPRQEARQQQRRYIELILHYRDLLRVRCVLLLALFQ